MGKRHGSAKVVELPKGSGRWYVRVHNNGERMVRKAGTQKEARRFAAEINVRIMAEKAGRGPGKAA